jgi:predicted transposase YbfD/YdcC
MRDFIETFESLDDPRTGNAKRHDLHEVLLIALLTTLSGGETCADMELFAETKLPFLRTFMTLENGSPSHDTFSRLFRLLDPAQFRACFIAFMQRFAEGCEGVVAFDGKTLRRSFDKASSSSPLHMVSAFAADARLVLGQIAVDDKSNEITAMPKLLDMLMLKGRVVTADALNCQREIAAKICEKEADYALALKGNQGNLYNDVQAFLDDPDTPLDTVETTDGDHGRIEVRTASVSADIDWLQDIHKWPGLQAVGKIVSTRETGGKASTETRYYLLSAAFPAARFNAIVRSHWAIENSLHWVLDVTMNEDQLRNRLDHGPENLAILRHLALNVAKLEPSKGSMRGKLKRAGWNDGYLLELLAQFKRVEVR